MFIRNIGLDTQGIDLSEASLRFVEALREASDLEGLLTSEPIEGAPGKFRIVPLSESEVDARFDAILGDLRALPDSEDRVIAITRHGFLWSAVTLRYVRGQFQTTTIADISAQLLLAQIGACWACGDGDKV